MSRRIITFLSCGALALGGAFVAGCGDDDTSSSGDTTTAAPAQEATAGAATEVSMKNNEFVPQEITAKVGERVKWTNDDSYPHNVVATKGEDFESDNFGGGGTYEYKLDKAGTIDYVCTIHPGMVGKIEVTQ